MPESSTAIVTSGRPVVVFHAVSGVDLSTRLMPRMPLSSLARELTSRLLASGVAANFHSRPPVRSLGAAPGDGGRHGNDARPGAGSIRHAETATTTPSTPLLMLAGNYSEPPAHRHCDRGSGRPVR